MLSDRSRPVVEATLPAIAENIEEIAQRFYRHMFAATPSCSTASFNRGNQAEGSQQAALAGSVAAFATALVEITRAAAGAPAVADRAQARVAGDPPGPVPGRARQPVLGHRRRPGRGGHA